MHLKEKMIKLPELSLKHPKRALLESYFCFEEVLILSQICVHFCYFGDSSFYFIIIIFLPIFQTNFIYFGQEKSPFFPFFFHLFLLVGG